MKGVAFVTFKTHESAVRAIAEKNGSKFHDILLVVEKRREFQQFANSLSSPYDDKTIVLTATRVTREEIQSGSFLPFLALHPQKNSLLVLLEYCEKAGKISAVDFTLGNKIYVNYSVSIFQISRFPSVLQKADLPFLISSDSRGSPACVG